MVSALFMPLGLLGIAQVTPWTSPRLTLVGKLQVRDRREAMLRVRGAG